MRLRDQIAIVTGAASGIGRATSLRFAGEGARLVLNDIDQRGLAIGSGSDCRDSSRAGRRQF